VRKPRKHLRPSVRFSILKRDRFTCRYCGAKAPDVKLRVDHIKPMSRGGSNHESNLVTACEECNVGKYVYGHEVDPPHIAASDDALVAFERLCRARGVENTDEIVLAAFEDAERARLIAAAVERVYSVPSPEEYEGELDS
jgi:HNH endonuclease